jgi:hypothetical protein
VVFAVVRRTIRAVTDTLSVLRDPNPYADGDPSSPISLLRTNVSSAGCHWRTTVALLTPFASLPGSDLSNPSVVERT